MKPQRTNQTIKKKVGANLNWAVVPKANLRELSHRKRTNGCLTVQPSRREAFLPTRFRDPKP